jgi:hypothetical protein
MHRLAKLSVVAALAIWCGCNNSAGPKLAPAGGVVRFAGKPLVGARVIFNPASGRPATGTTDAEGRFQLSTLRPGDGAMLGPHRVAVIGPRDGFERMPGPGEAPAPAAPAGGLPKRYSTPETSGLEFEVQPDTKNDFVLELE